jgi:hypothetical protein
MKTILSIAAFPFYAGACIVGIAFYFLMGKPKPCDRMPLSRNP